MNNSQVIGTHNRFRLFWLNPEFEKNKIKTTDQKSL